MSRVGLMLYTVRRECARDFRGTLGEVSALGFEGVELHDLFGHASREVGGWLDALGLGAAGWHVQLRDLEAGLDDLAVQASELGTSRLVVPWIEVPGTVAAADELADRLDRLAQDAAARGLVLCFHNHAGELRPLEDGRSFLDRLLERTIALELDLGWAWWAGADPLELLRHTAGRVPLAHVKDFRDRETHSFCPVGDGAVGYERIVGEIARYGIEWMLVEQDETEGPALEAAARSLAALTPMVEAA
jgi:sugar phosphate isomerase/epimerase